MKISTIAENAGSSFVLSFLSSLALSSFKNRSMKNKIISSVRSGGAHAKNTVLHGITVNAFENCFNRTPNILFASFLTGSIFANRNTTIKCIQNGLLSSASAYFFDFFNNKK